MILLIHISSALASLVLTTLLYVRPSQRKLFASYALTAGTLLSGTYIVASTNAHLLQACTTGLLYLSGVSVGIFAARRKLATQQMSSGKYR